MARAYQLNRILTAKTTATSGANCWSYTYGIDVWANLNSAQPITGYSCTQSNLSLSINTNNRITNTGVSYDTSGKTLTDGLNTYTWDAESQIKTAAGVTYTYDGDGNRVKKSSGKLYWYGSGSAVLDESDASGNFTDEYVFFGGKRVAHRVVSTGSIYYYAEDFLGSSRVITTATGAVCYEADFLPFGGERLITNTCPQNYKFTGKERDAETGNDDFGARYFSPSLGRWLSPDWSAIPAPVPYATLTNPQTLNLYQYVGNNPETFADMDGHLWPIGVQDPPIGHNSADETAEAVICAIIGDSCSSASDKEEKEAKAKTEAAQKPPPAQNQPELVIVPDKKKPLSLPGGTEQYVNYNINSMDSSGKVTPLPQDNDNKVELKEKLLKGSAGVCDGGRNCADVGKATDRMVVTTGKGHSVEKRFEIDGKAARIYDPGSKKAYDFVRVDASVKKGFVFNYGNDPQ